ncbi:MAG: M48 family metalloprotease [Halioglobus sp.]
MSTSALRGLAAAALVMLVGCAGNPATNTPTVVMSSRSGEAEIGAEMHKEMMDEGVAYDDKQLQAYVDKIGQRLVKHSDEPDMTFTFTVVDSPDINAFALPGGYIYINRGLLAYMDNEAELAGVLGHEIAHVTARHHGRGKAADISNKTAATLIYILTGSGNIASASATYGQELVSGYGREMELEADGLGAQYMHGAGYDPDALLEVIGVLKDHERYQRLKAREGGKRVSTYHGLYATHPRNDQRLQTIISAAADLEGYAENPEIPGEFKQRMDGLVWGDSVQRTRAEDRYYNDRLRFTIKQPAEWTVSATSQDIVFNAPDSSASLSITISYRDPGNSAEETLANTTRGELRDDKALEQAGLKGHTAIEGVDADSRRVAVIDYGNLTFLMVGEATDFDGADPQLLELVESFRPIHPRETKAGNGARVRYIQVPRGTTLADLATGSPEPDAEAQMRLMNGLYPSGEPRTGDWIKVIR